jgi:hypothetical protein
MAQITSSTSTDNMPPQEVFPTTNSNETELEAAAKRKKLKRLATSLLVWPIPTVLLLGNYLDALESSAVTQSLIITIVSFVLLSAVISLVSGAYILINLKKLTDSSNRSQKTKEPATHSGNQSTQWLAILLIVWPFVLLGLFGFIAPLIGFGAAFIALPILGAVYIGGPISIGAGLIMLLRARRQSKPDEEKIV